MHHDERHIIKIVLVEISFKHHLWAKNTLEKNQTVKVHIEVAIWYNRQMLLLCKSKGGFFSFENIR